MKPLIIPIAIGLLAGLGGGTGYAYMKASQNAAHAAPADSTAKHDSTAHDSTTAEGEHATATDSAAIADSAAKAEALPLTPADSIRALELARAMIRSGKAEPAAAEHEPVTTKLSDVKPADPKSAAAHAMPEPTKGAVKPEPAKATPAKAEPGKADPKAEAKGPTASAAAVVKDARDAAMHTPLPEQRLAKIFGAMAPKDAAKVMEQMSDSDVRAILAFMGDKQAGAVLALLSPARVANITRGGTKAPESK
jgi:hypothetical protein